MIHKAHFEIIVFSAKLSWKDIYWDEFSIFLYLKSYFSFSLWTG